MCSSLMGVGQKFTFFNLEKLLSNVGQTKIINDLITRQQIKWSETIGIF